MTVSQSTAVTLQFLVISEDSAPSVSGSAFTNKYGQPRAASGRHTGYNKLSKRHRHSYIDEPQK